MIQFKIPDIPKPFLPDSCNHHYFSYNVKNWVSVFFVCEILIQVPIVKFWEEISRPLEIVPPSTNTSIKALSIKLGIFSRREVLFVRWRSAVFQV